MDSFGLTAAPAIPPGASLAETPSLPKAPDDRTHGLDTFLPGEIIRTLLRYEGHFALIKTEHEWMVGVHFGHDGDLAAGAAYGFGYTPEDAMLDACKDLGRK